MFSICKSNPISLIGKRILGKLHEYCTEVLFLCSASLKIPLSIDFIFSGLGAPEIISNVI